MTNELAKMLILLANRIASKANFANYSYREDMVAESLANLAKHALKFDEAKSNNPFAFYTSAIMNSFYQYLNNEKKHRNIRDTLLIKKGIMHPLGLWIVIAMAANIMLSNQFQMDLYHLRFNLVGERRNHLQTIFWSLMYEITRDDGSCKRI